MEFIKIREHPEMAERAAGWFHEKWGVPRKEYADSIQECIEQRSAVPQWYLMLEEGQILGGLGVIENDFHNRKDLAPNVCAVYVEEAYRCRGIAGEMLKQVCEDMERQGIDTLYLITDHTGFYERYGWRFLCMVQGEGEEEPIRMYIHDNRKPA
ncbi:MAG TPA: GNAT family N-acetyltransferase [Candidatus Choladousia intestinavium]|uniref:GNAT family N-acetyltransferase n=1 Tax=Candidatus Choladousia intestinavium TaxID=2840727 RepID=A0A9D1A9B8_9FIRM|nr:GNAT family N-acetyltransferase [Candidatus Choladousia intestinavium]